MMSSHCYSPFLLPMHIIFAGLSAHTSEGDEGRGVWARQFEKGLIGFGV